MNNTNTTDSVLSRLRALIPRRCLTNYESLRLAELQANRLLELFTIAGPLVPSELVTELPRLEVRFDPDLPASGTTHWEAGRWVITLNASEPSVRRRFSLMHEFKHVLDHTTRQYLYGDVANNLDAAARAERAADQFAACLLMPKRWIKSEWFSSGQRPSIAARRFDVSPQALSVRLWKLGMAPDVQRCLPPHVFDNERNRMRYFRTASPLKAAA